MVTTNEKLNLEIKRLIARRELTIARFELEELKVKKEIANLDFKIHKREKKARIIKAFEEKTKIAKQIKELKNKEIKKEFIPGVGGYINDLKKKIESEKEIKTIKIELKEKADEIRNIKHEI